MSDIRLQIYGVPPVLDRLRRVAAALKPDGAFGQGLVEAGNDLRDYAASVTHEDTGNLAGAHRVRVSGLKVELYLDPGAINPRSHQSAALYGPFEHARGGDHAFYDRTRREKARQVPGVVWAKVKESL